MYLILTMSLLVYIELTICQQQHNSFQTKFKWQSGDPAPFQLWYSSARNPVMLTELYHKPITPQDKPEVLFKWCFLRVETTNFRFRLFSTLSTLISSARMHSDITIKLRKPQMATYTVQQGFLQRCFVLIQ